MGNCRDRTCEAGDESREIRAELASYIKVNDEVRRGWGLALDRAMKAEEGQAVAYEAVHEARAEVARLRAYLDTLEWRGSTSIDYECEWAACPECGGLESETTHNSWRKPVGHQPGCKMPEMLRTTSPQEKP